LTRAVMGENSENANQTTLHTSTRPASSRTCWCAQAAGTSCAKDFRIMGIGIGFTDEALSFFFSLPIQLE